MTDVNQRGLYVLTKSLLAVISCLEQMRGVLAIVRDRVSYSDNNYFTYVAKAVLLIRILEFSVCSNWTAQKR